MSTVLGNGQTSGYSDSGTSSKSMAYESEFRCRVTHAWAKTLIEKGKLPMARQASKLRVAGSIPAGQAMQNQLHYSQLWSSANVLNGTSG
jgi:hypothetical protein